MRTTDALTRALDQPAIDRAALPVQDAVRQTFEAGGPTGHQVKEALHGAWLGHPLHPVLTDVPLGAWTAALALDAAAHGDAAMRRAATFVLGVGLLGAAGAAVTGLTDWSDTQGRARRTGLVHGLLNIAATSSVACAYFRRRRDSYVTASGWAWLGFGLAVASAYLGGDLVYTQGVGVARADADTQLESRRASR